MSGAISGRRGDCFSVAVLKMRKKSGDSFYSSPKGRVEELHNRGTVSVSVAVSEWTAIQVFFSLMQLKVFLHTNKPNGPG